MVPEELRYTKEHEWIKIEGDTATVGITDHAQSALGDVVYCELPQPGAELKKGETFGAIESVKAATDVYSPVTGEVVEFNDTLSTQPGIVNQSAQVDGWIVKVKLTNMSELDELLTEEDYSKIHAE